MIAARVAGIPCLIQVDHYFVQRPLGRYCDSRDDCYGYTDIDYTICDRKGRPAPWLEKKATKKDHDEIIKRIEEEAKYGREP